MTCNTLGCITRYMLAAFLVMALSGTTMAQQPDQHQALQPLPNRVAALPIVSHEMSGTMGTISSRRTPAPNIVTKTVDMKETIAKFASVKNLKLNEARLESLLFLGMNPLDRSRRSPDDIRPTFELADVDKFEITADESFFVALPSMMRSLELGKKQVVIQIISFAIDPRQTTRVNSFIEQGTARVNCAKLPRVVPIATADENVVSGHDVSPESFISTTTVVRENMPVTTGQITTENLKKLEQYLQDSQHVGIWNAPAIAVLPGQVATISDISLRPFVVGLNTIQGDRVAANQPVIQAVEDGTTIRVKAIPRGERIQILSDIAISRVVDVNTFTVSGIGDAQQHAIQIPKQSLRQVNFSAMLEPDRAVLIDPNFTQVKIKKDDRGRQIENKLKLMFVLRALIIDVETGPDKLPKVNIVNEPRKKGAE